jgi:4-hydroxybenzoate polyprenyltransferase
MNKRLAKRWQWWVGAAVIIIPFLFLLMLELISLALVFIASLLSYVYNAETPKSIKKLFVFMNGKT